LNEGLVESVALCLGHLAATNPLCNWEMRAHQQNFELRMLVVEWRISDPVRKKDKKKTNVGGSDFQITIPVSLMSGASALHVALHDTPVNVVLPRLWMIVRHGPWL